MTEYDPVSIINAKLQGGDVDVTFDQMDQFLKGWQEVEPVHPEFVKYCLESVNVRRDDLCFYK